MKKFFVILVGVVTLVACHSKQAEKADVFEQSGTFVGTLPAADCSGIVYKLTIDGDTAFSLDMTYLEAIDGRDTTFVSSGKVERLKDDNAIKLESEDGVMYFKVVNDSTLRMVNDSLQEAQTSLNYDIVKVK